MGAQMEEAMKKAGLVRDRGVEWLLRQERDEAEQRAVHWREKYAVARRQCRQLVAAALCAIGAGFMLGYMLAEAFCGS